MEAERETLMPNILFTPEFIAPADSAVYQEYIMPVLNSGCDYIILHSENEEKKHILWELQRIFELACEKQPNKLDIQICASVLWRDFIKIFEDCWNGRVTERDILLQQRVRTMMQFVAENHMRKITLEDIALSANLSKSEVLRCFHKMLHTTPVNYLIDYRLNRAKERLLASSDTVTRIAAEIGIDNVSYFVRVFTRKFGVTPRVFRERNQ